MQTIAPTARVNPTPKINGSLKKPGKLNARLPAIAPRRFNWRGNRPRMGKRGMCGMCGHLALCEVIEGDTCYECGERTIHDVSYDDPIE